MKLQYRTGQKTKLAGLRYQRWIYFALPAAAAVIIILLIIIITGNTSPQPQPGDTTATPSNTTAPMATSNNNVVRNVQDAPYFTGEIRRLTVPDNYARHPAICGDEAVFIGGSGPLDQPVMKALYLADLTQINVTRLLECPQGGELFTPKLSMGYIAWIESRGNTHSVKIYSRITRTERVLCEFLGWRPLIALAGDCLAVQARIAENRWQLMEYDLRTGGSESLCEYVLPLGLETPGGDGASLAFANADGGLTLRKPGADDKAFSPGFPPFSPVVSGDTTAFLDGPPGPQAALFGVYDNKLTFVDRDVAGYAVGRTHVVFGKNERIYAFSLTTQALQCLTPQGEKGRMPTACGKWALWVDWKAAGNNAVLFVELE